MTFDVIILSHSKTKEHRKITEDCINSLLVAENKIKINIFVIESFDKNANFKGATTFFYQQESFNYNHSMNFGFGKTKSDYVFFANNDLIFLDKWADNCYHAFKMGFESLSPYCNVTHTRFTKDGDFMVQGYQVGFHIAGWCIGVSRKMFERIGGFDESVAFWYSDNLYVEQIKAEGIKHVLVCNSYVTHLDFGSKTLLSMSPSEKIELTSNQKKKYNLAVRRIWSAKEKKVLH